MLKAKLKNNQRVSRREKEVIRALTADTKEETVDTKEERTTPKEDGTDPTDTTTGETTGEKELAADPGKEECTSSATTTHGSTTNNSQRTTHGIKARSTWKRHHR